MTPEDLSGATSVQPDAPTSDLPIISRGPVSPLGGEPPLGSEPPTESEEDVEARLAYESLMRHRRARRRKKIVAGAIVAGAALVAGIAWAVLSSPPDTSGEAPLQTTSLFRSEFVESVQAAGAAQPLSSVMVTPEVDGIIGEVRVALGQSVSEGDVLLTIRNDELDRAVREAEIGVRSAKASLAAARDSYDSTYRDYQTQEPVTNEAGEVTGYQRRAEWSAVQQAQASVDSAQLQVESAQQAYDQAVQTAAKRTVTAPASGSVVVMGAVPGAAVGAGASGQGGSALIQIADLSQMTVSVQVNEVDISRVAVGQKARVTFSALPGAMLDAEVTSISAVSSASAEGGYGGYGVVTYDVELLIPEPTADLKPGMTANVEILMQCVPDALTVPASSLATDDGTSYYVYVMTDPETEACERRDVTVTAQSATTAVVEGDVAEGDLVVLDPYAVTPAEGEGAGAGASAGGPSDDATASDAVALDEGAEA